MQLCYRSVERDSISFAVDEVSMVTKKRYKISGINWDGWEDIL